MGRIIRNILTITALALAGPVVAEPPSEDHAAGERQFAALLEAVRTADKPGTAAAGYARANALRPDAVALHEAYLRRMLTFGLPTIAVHPARQLVRLDAGSGLAWGVLGYAAGREGDLPEAFSRTMRAVELAGDNPGILHNAGQLVAWYDAQPNPPEVSAASRRILQNQREKLRRSEQFTAAYERLVGAERGVSEALEKLDARLDEAEAALARVRNDALAIDAEIRGIEARIDLHEERIDDLSRDLIYGYYTIRPDYGHRRHYGPRYYRTYPSYRRRREIREEIEEHEEAIDRLAAEAAQLRGHGRAVLRELAARRDIVEELAARREELIGGFERHFRWDPPAVDGKITSERENADLGPAERLDVPSDPETEAANRLKLARLYLDNDMYDRAAAVLEELLSKYADTDAADEARKILRRGMGRPEAEEENGEAG